MSQSRFSLGFGGFLFGIVFGLAVAAAVAVFTFNSPLPFVDKVQKVTADVDPAQALAGGVDPNKALNASSTPETTAAAPAGTVATVTASTAPATTPAAAPAAPAPANTTAATNQTQTSADLQPQRDEQGKAAQPGTVTPVSYWVQAGAFKSTKQAEERQAQLAMMAVEAQVQQAGSIWRVRIGPFDDRNSANEIQNMLNDQGIQATIIKQQN